MTRINCTYGNELIPYRLTFGFDIGILIMGILEARSVDKHMDCFEHFLDLKGNDQKCQYE